MSEAPKGFNGGYNEDGTWRWHKIDPNASPLEKKQIELDCMTRLKQIQEQRTAHWRSLHELGQDEIARLGEDLRTYMSAAAKAYDSGFHQGYETAVTVSGKASERSDPPPGNPSVTDEMVERFAAELWKLDDAYARSIPHAKIRAALVAALKAAPPTNPGLGLL